MFIVTEYAALKKLFLSANSNSDFHFQRLMKKAFHFQNGRLSSKIFDNKICLEVR